MMTESDSGITNDELDTLADELEAGDYVQITLDTGLELTAYVTDAYHDTVENPPSEPVPVPGSLDVRMELPNSEYHRLNEQRDDDVNTQSASFHVKERRRGRWDTPVPFTMYDPVAEDGIVVSEEWTTLGDITAIEITDEPEDDADD